MTSLYGAWVFEPPAELIVDESVDSGPRCSAKGCRAGATVDLHWRNPRLHDAARVKHWLACDTHADSLADFLRRRGFLLDRSPLSS